MWHGCKTTRLNARKNAPASRSSTIITRIRRSGPPIPGVRTLAGSIVANATSTPLMWWLKRAAIFSLGHDAGIDARWGRSGGLQRARVAIESNLIQAPGEPASGRPRSPPQPGRSGGEILETAMPKYSQANRPLSVTTPLGTDVLLLQRFSGEEAVSKLFCFELDLLAESTATVKFDAILGQGVTVTLVMPADGSKRYFNGIVSRFSQGGRSAVGPGERHLHSLSRRGGPPVLVAHAEPPEPDLPAARRPRHPQEGPHRDEGKLSAPGAIQAARLLRPVPRDRLRLRQPAHGGGGDLLFLHARRRLAPDGGRRHAAELPRRARPEHLDLRDARGGTRTEDRVHRWEKSQTLRSGRYRLWDSCFELPGKNLESVKPTLGSVQVGTVAHNLSVGNTNLEIYDYPGGYAQRFDGVTPGGGDRSSDVQNIFPDGTRTVGIRMQEEAAAALLLEGESTCRQLGVRVQVHPQPALRRQRLLRPDPGGARRRRRRCLYPGQRRSPRIPTPSSASPPRCRSGRSGRSPAPGSTGPSRPSSSATRGTRSSPTSTGGSRSSSPGTARARTTPTAHAGSAWRPPGPAPSGGSSTSPASARRWSSPSRKGTPTGRSSSAACTTPRRCPPTRSPTT